MIKGKHAIAYVSQFLIPQEVGKRTGLVFACKDAVKTQVFLGVVLLLSLVCCCWCVVVGVVLLLLLVCCCCC